MLRDQRLASPPNFSSHSSMVERTALTFSQISFRGEYFTLPEHKWFGLVFFLVYQSRSSEPPQISCENANGLAFLGWKGCRSQRWNARPFFERTSLLRGPALRFRLESLPPPQPAIHSILPQNLSVLVPFFFFLKSIHKVIHPPPLLFRTKWLDRFVLNGGLYFF